MRKSSLFILLTIIMLILCGCGQTNNQNTATIDHSRFVKIDTVQMQKDDVYSVAIIVDKQTGVQYLLEEGNRGHTSFMTVNSNLTKPHHN